ncbi:MAG: hypothetical protein WDO15_18190 [Bacteroidota bacterium]
MLPKLKALAGAAYHADQMNVYTVGLGVDVNDAELIGIAGGANRFFKVMNDHLALESKTLIIFTSRYSRRPIT